MNDEVRKRRQRTRLRKETRLPVGHHGLAQSSQAEQTLTVSSRYCDVEGLPTSNHRFRCTPRSPVFPLPHPASPRGAPPPNRRGEFAVRSPDKNHRRSANRSRRRITDQAHEHYHGGRCRTQLPIVRSPDVPRSGPNPARPAELGSDRFPAVNRQVCPDGSELMSSFTQVVCPHCSQHLKITGSPPAARSVAPSARVHSRPGHVRRRPGSPVATPHRRGQDLRAGAPRGTGPMGPRRTRARPLPGVTGRQRTVDVGGRTVPGAD